MESGGPPRLERAEGRLHLSFRPDRSQESRIHRCYQQGSSKVRFPRSGAVPQAVMLNTAGGMTGGDRFSVVTELAPNAAATLTTQAAEKVYRSSAGEARIDIAMTLEAGARLHWLPQETILFDGGRLARRLDVEMEASAQLLLCESVILGRAAHGETVRSASFRDQWRIRRGSRLVYAEALRLEGDLADSCTGRATLGGARAFATILHLASDAEDAVEDVRAALRDAPAISGASAWDSMLAVRMVAADGAALRRTLLAALSGIGVTPPRVWSI